MSESFIQIPRSLFTDPLWIKLSPECQLVFIQILSRVCYLPQKFDDHGTIIDLKIGDVCTTFRDMEKWFNHKDFSRTKIERCIKKLILCRFCGQQVRHIKSIVSITHKETYDLLIKYNETRSGTGLRQDRDKIETQKDKEDKDISNDISKKEEAQTAARLRSKDVLSFDFQKWEFVGITEKDQADWKLMYPHLNLSVEALKEAQWLKNNQSKSNKKSFRKYLTGWYGRANDAIENKKAFRSAASSGYGDRRTKNKDGTPIHSTAEGLF
jgi:hypothetical protein